MTLQEKIQNIAEGYGKLASLFLEGAKFALENQWISTKEDLPCNHEELIYGTKVSEGTETVEVFARNEHGDIWDDYMIYENGKWRWNDFEPDYWMIVPKLSKEKKSKTMTREEEIRNAIDTIIPKPPLLDGKTYEQALMAIGFEAGVKWADAYPKSLWISVDDDLPCNHKELLVNDTLTKSVIIRNSDGSIEFSLMYLDGKWYWETDEPTHWFPIPKPPKK